jgi:hypothetical protein
MMTEHALLLVQSKCAATSSGIVIDVVTTRPSSSNSSVNPFVSGQLPYFG